jgi:hypothetical protein
VFREEKEGISTQTSQRATLRDCTQGKQRTRRRVSQEHRLKPVLHGGRSCCDTEISLLLYDCVVGLVKEHIAAWHTAFEAAQAIANPDS